MKLSDEIKIILAQNSIECNDKAMNDIDEAVIHKVAELRDKLRDTIENDRKLLKMQYNDAIKKTENYMESVKYHIQAIEDVNEELQEENDELKAKNDRLYDRLREQSNKDREIYPKKERSGYVFVSCQEFEKTYYSGYDLPSTTVCWRTTYETPYSILLDEQDVRQRIEYDVMNLLSQSGCDTYDPEYEDWESGNNVCFKIFLATTSKGYWNVSVYTTDYIKILNDNLN